MITGLPGCSEATELESLRFLTETEPDEAGWYLLAPFPSTPLWAFRDRFGATIFEDDIRANDWDVAQAQADNAAITCYVDYGRAGGLDRHALKTLWLAMREAWEESRRRTGGAFLPDTTAAPAAQWPGGRSVVELARWRPGALA